MSGSILGDLRGLGRLARDLPPFLRRRLGADTAAAIVRRRLAGRTERFLEIVERAIYANPRSPYLRLLRSAGCEAGDLRALVAREGLEGALQALLSAGVFLTLDEFKGHRAVERGTTHVTCALGDLDNPLVVPHIEAHSGGTRGPAVSVRSSLAFIDDLAASTAVALRAHGLERHAHAVWLNAGVTPELIYARQGMPPIAWHYAVRPLSLRIRGGAWYLALLAGLVGRSLPTPRHVDLFDPARMAVWLARQLPAHPGLCLTTYAGSAARVAHAATERGLHLGGACFITLGEPCTAAKRRAVEAAGGRLLVRYAFTEAGILGYGCADPEAPDDVHLFSDCFAVSCRSHAVTAAGPVVDALHFTSLLPSSPMVLLNVASGDHATTTSRSCGCGLGALGLDTHLSSVRSFEKLTGTTTTFVGTGLLRALEEVLPARFGGAPGDYQLVEDAGRLHLLVSPRLGRLEEAALREAFLGAVTADGGLTGSTSNRLAALDVWRRRPFHSGAGKLLPFHLIEEAWASA